MNLTPENFWLYFFAVFCFRMAWLMAEAVGRWAEFRVAPVAELTLNIHNRFEDTKVAKEPEAQA